MTCLLSAPGAKPQMTLNMPRHAEADGSITHLTTQDGCSFDVQVFAGPVNACRTVLCFPAMGVPGRYYQMLASALRDSGNNVVVGELRGVGSHSLRASHSVDWGYETMVLQEWPAVIELARSKFPNTKLCFLGHSIGGQISSLYLSTHPEVSDELILVASSSMGYRNFERGGYRFLAVTHAIAAFTQIAGIWPGEFTGLMGRQAKQEMLDWARNARTGQYHLGAEKVDYESRFANFRGRILAISIDNDGHTPWPTVASLVRKFVNADRRHIRLANIQLPDGVIGHINWPRYPERIVPGINRWLAGDTVPDIIQSD